jgi:hypothetical protein
MRKFLPLVAVFAVAASPAVAQVAAPTQPEPAEKPKMVTKVVCERITAEEETGSRLGAAPKKCRRVEVPAKPDENKAAGTQPQGHSAHAH